MFGSRHIYDTVVFTVSSLQFLIGMGLSLLLYGYGLTEQENALIDAAGEPEYPPVCSVNPSLHYEYVAFLRPGASLQSFTVFQIVQPI